jgi:hypothetical protein
VGRKQAPDSPPMSRRKVAISPDDGSAIDLKQPELAAFLSWLVPGLGQIYQGRTLKGGLFMGAVMVLLVAGMWLGDSRVVYASWKKTGDSRWWFACQAGVGLVAIPAVVQTCAVNGAAKEPWFGSSFMAPPLVAGQLVSRRYAQRLADHDPDILPDDFFDRPPLKQFHGDQFSMWHRRLGRFFELGTLYTALAGMLNMLVIYDAWSGPMRPSADGRKRENGNEQERSGQPEV